MHTQLVRIMGYVTAYDLISNKSMVYSLKIGFIGLSMFIII